MLVRPNKYQDRRYPIRGSRQPKTTERPVSPRGHTEKRPFRVLLADDDYYSIVPLKKIFEDLDCEVVVAEGGVETMERLKKEPLDLLVLDWVMPDMAGNEALEEVQRNLDTGRWDGAMAFKEENLPVVSFSALPQHTMLFPEVHSMTYLDHWKKPMPYSELHRRAREVILAIKTEKAKH